MVCTVDEPLVPGRHALYTLRHLRSILSSVRSGSALQVIGIELQYRYMYNGVGMEPSYMLHRQYLIDDLLGNETVAILSGFPSLRLLYIDLFDYEHEEFDSQWWTAEMGRRLPLNLRAAVSVRTCQLVLNPGSKPRCVVDVPDTISNPIHRILARSFVVYPAGSRTSRSKSEGEENV